MTENTVRQLASNIAPAVLPFVQNWAGELHAVNDNEEPDGPPAAAARIPWNPPFTVLEPRDLKSAA